MGHGAATDARETLDVIDRELKILHQEICRTEEMQGHGADNMEGSLPTCGRRLLSALCREDEDIYRKVDTMLCEHGSCFSLMAML